VIAATNQDLEAMVNSGRFRNDLFHRIGQINITVPPLRERHEDIVPLAEYFLRQQNPNLGFSDDALEMLESYHWPGNIRELRNTIIKAAVLITGSQVEASDLTISRAPRYKTNGPVPINMPMAPAAGGNLDRSNPERPNLDRPNLDRIEKHAILETLAKTNGHQQRAAELLGISRRTLSRKLKLYGMEAQETCAS